MATLRKHWSAQSSRDEFPRAPSMAAAKTSFFAFVAVVMADRFDEKVVKFSLAVVLIMFAGFTSLQKKRRGQHHTS